MNIIEAVRQAVESFPKIAKVCNEVHIDFTDPEPTSYGLTSIAAFLSALQHIFRNKRL